MVTKRQLGFGFIALSILAAISPFAVDWWRASTQRAFSPEFGPMQLAILAGAALLFLVGLSLLPLGDRPA